MAKEFDIKLGDEFERELFGPDGTVAKALKEHFAYPVQQYQESRGPISQDFPTSDQGLHMVATVTIRPGYDKVPFVDVGPEATADDFPYPIAVELGLGDSPAQPFIRRSLTAMPKEY